MFLKQFWVAFKIWVIALGTNTIGGSLYLTGDLEKEVMYIGLIYGSIFSVPILIILLIVIRHCVSRRKNGLEIFRYVLITGLVLTIFSSIFFMALLPGAPAGLIVISTLAAVTGIGMQHNALFKLAIYEDEFEKFLS